MNVGRAAAVLLGVAFLVAGAAKLASRGWPAQGRALGAPRWLVPVLPFVELALGGLLVTGLGLPWTAIAAIVLLAAFTVALTVPLLQGRRVPCACFGAASRPISWWSVARNVALLGLGALALT